MTDRKPLPGDDLSRIAARTAELLPDLHHARFLVIGANGFIGSWLAEALAAQGSPMMEHCELTSMSARKSCVF